MRRPLTPLLLSGLLLTACTSGTPERSAPASASGAAAVSAAPDDAPDIEGLVVESEKLSHKHQDEPVDYGRVPPLGGPHHPRWLACDVYDEPVPNEVAVHSLEHGAVWFTYDPDLPADEVEELAALAKRNRQYVLVSPLEGLDSRIVAAAWGASLEATSAGDPRLGQFLEAYAGGDQGGEPGAPCRRGGLKLREARKLFGTST
jgi:hypothetical protein